jgi:hypothetical protein
MDTAAAFAVVLHVEGLDFSKMKPPLHNSSYCIAITLEFWSVTNSLDLIEWKYWQKNAFFFCLQALHYQ